MPLEKPPQKLLWLPIPGLPGPQALLQHQHHLPFFIFMEKSKRNIIIILQMRKLNGLNELLKATQIRNSDLIWFQWSFLFTSLQRINETGCVAAPSFLYPCYSKCDWQMINHNGMMWKTVRMQSLRPILHLRNQNLHYEHSPQIFLHTLTIQKHQSLSVLILGSLWFLFFSKLPSLYNLPQTENWCSLWHATDKQMKAYNWFGHIYPRRIVESSLTFFFSCFSISSNHSSKEEGWLKVWVIHRCENILSASH